MNHEARMKQHGLEYYGGDGFDDLPEAGSYTVCNLEDNSEAHFDSLSSARQIYEAMTAEKQIWEENVFPELIDAWVKA